MELNGLVEKIYTEIQKSKRRDKYFSRLGASGIGKPCLRAIFYSWRSFTDKEFPGRILRLFESGFIQEDRLVADLQRAGVKVWAVDDDGRQFKFFDESGHFVAKIDGVALGAVEGSEERMLLEIKTMSDKAFKGISKKGIKQEHNYQIHAGMWLLGLNFGLYVVVNKNDEQIHIEVVERDPKIIADLQNRLDALIMGGTAPPRISDTQTSFHCRWCDHKPVCAGDVPPVKSCRSCVHVTPIEHGEWLCEYHMMSLNMKRQVSGCEDYLEFGK